MPAIRHILQTLRTAPSEAAGKQVVRYGIIACSGYVLAIALYSGELAIGINPYSALGVAFVLNGLYNFTLMRIWAFPPSYRGVASDLGRFSSVALLSLGVNYSSFAVLYSAIALPAATAQRIAILIAAPVTFLTNRLWAFRATRHAPRLHRDADACATSARKESYSRM